NRKHRAVAGNKSPAIPAMTYIQRELLQKQLRPCPGDRHGVIAFQLRRGHRFPRELPERGFPVLSVHEVSPSLEQKNFIRATARRGFSSLPAIVYSPQSH